MSGSEISFDKRHIISKLKLMTARDDTFDSSLNAPTSPAIGAKEENYESGLS